MIREKNKKAMYFTMDGMLAGLLIVGITVMLMQSSYYEPRTEQKSFLTQDFLNTLAEIKLYEIDNSFIQQEIANGNITDENKSVLEQIGQYWALEENSKAETLIKSLINFNYTETNLKVSLENDTILSGGTNDSKNIVASSRMIAGVARGDPLTGYSSSAYLKKIRNKRYTSYAYLGGFIGQGKISTKTEPLPSDISSAKIDTITLEGDFAGNFTFLINDKKCNSSGTQELFETDATPLIVSKWNLTHCREFIKSGINNLTLDFQGKISQKYAAGGLFKVIYRTDSLLQNKTEGFTQNYLSGALGVANIYDSFYIPGNLTSMNILLHFNSNDQTYLTVGERIIEINVTGGDQRDVLDDNYLKNTIGLDYSMLSLNTVPLRFASYNATSATVVSGDADVVVITDFSGSMKKAVGAWDDQGTGKSDCEELYTYPDARKTHLARCLDNDLVNTVMNFSGNRVWPVFYHNNNVEWYNNPNDKEAIEGYISTFGPQGKGETCISCAINQAYDILNTYSNESRSKFIVLMSDGAPTHCADGSCTSTSTEYGNEMCVGYCDTSGLNGCKADEKEGCALADLTCKGAENNTLYSVDRTYNDLNATIFTVGFGLIDECDRAYALLEEIANMTNGTYQHSSNVTELQMIYNNISMEILNRVKQENQTVNVISNLTGSDLYNDSYINFTYNPVASSAPQGSISVTMETNLNSCTDTIEIPKGLTLQDAKVTSYSGTHWADLVIVNNVTVFNLSKYYVPYYRLGDPFVIQVPISYLKMGYNNVTVETGDSAENRTGCSDNNTFIYSGYVPSVTSRSDVKEKLEGCSWDVEFEDGTSSILKVPNNYTGAKTCSYQSGNISYDTDDTYDAAIYKLFKQLDLDSDGRVLINMNNFDLEITTTTIGNVPYLWGPSMIRVEVHQ